MRRELAEEREFGRVRRRFGVTVVGVKRAGEDFTHAVATTVLEPGDLVIVSGERRKVERFAELGVSVD
jgi:trk system potassium uptake protein TrkA